MLWVSVIATSGAIWRVGYAILSRDRPPSADGFFYHLFANDMVGPGAFDDAFPTARHPPLWQIVLATGSRLRIDTILGHQLIAAAIGVATIVTVAMIAVRIAGTRVALLGAGIVALHPNVWIWERELAAETLVLPLVALTIGAAYGFVRAPGLRGALALGALCGLLALTRAEQILLLPLLVAPLVLRVHGVPITRRIAWLALASATTVALLAPWMLHNRGRFDESVLLTTSAGVTLVGSNCPASYHGPRIGHFDLDVWAAPDPARPDACPSSNRDGDESVVDHEMQSLAFAYIGDNVERVPLVSLARQGRTWGLYRPLQQSELDQEWGHSPLWAYRAGAAVHIVVLGLALLGAVLLGRRGRTVLPLAVFPLLVLVTTAVTYGQPRFRVAAEVSLAVLAAVALDHLLERHHGDERRGLSEDGPSPPS